MDQNRRKGACQSKICTGQIPYASIHHSGDLTSGRERAGCPEWDLAGHKREEEDGGGGSL